MGGTTGVVLEDSSVDFGSRSETYASPKSRSSSDIHHDDDVPTSPSILESLSAGASTIVAALSNNLSGDDDDTLHKYSADTRYSDEEAW
eukprot:7278327-Ditylum_brightwellii.AAC.1